MKQLRYWWWLISAFTKKQWKIIFFGILGAVTLVSIRSYILKYLPVFNTSTIGVIGRYRNHELPSFITGKITGGLVRISPTGLPQPDLATLWSVSEDGTAYTFEIDPNKIWHDNSKIKAADIAINIPDVETEIIDDKTIIFKLKEPYAPFPTLLSRPLFKRGLIGTGEYKVKKIYYNGEFIDQLVLVNHQRTSLKYRFYRTSQEIITAFKLGEINQIEELTSLENFPSWKEFTIEPVLHHDRYVAVFFNTNDQNLSEKTFRQALTYAIPDKPGGEKRALSPINPNSWAYNPQVKPYNTDLNQARELIKSLFADKELPKLELTAALPYLSWAEKIAAAWTKIGIETRVKVSPAMPDDFQTYITGQQIPSDPDQYFFWHSTQSTNLTHYAAPKVDKLLEDGRKTLDQNKRIEIYRDFQRFLLEDCPAAFLEYQTTYTVKRK